MHLHLFEFEDLEWFPDTIRRGQTDYLHFMISRFKIYEKSAEVLKILTDKTGITNITDLCSGGGGGMDSVQKKLEEVTGKDIRITLTDKYPNIAAFEEIKNSAAGKVNFINSSVDALEPEISSGTIRTIYSAFHHFKPEDAKKIISNAVDAGDPVAIFEGAEKNLKNFLGILLFTPVFFFFITPFMKPFRLSRLFFTYIIPLIPLTTVWDGIVSVLRMYTPAEMFKMAESCDKNKSYTWYKGTLKNKMGTGVMYLAGYKSI